MRLICPQKNDAFTVNDTSKGNGALTYGIGLVTTDEVVLAGGWDVSNSGYYLYSGQSYWTMSPYSLSYDLAIERNVFPSGLAGYNDGGVISKGGARPVFNLKADVLTYGDGTMNNPYRLTENIDSTTPSGSGSSASGGMGWEPGHAPGIDGGEEGGQGEGGL